MEQLGEKDVENVRQEQKLNYERRVSNNAAETLADSLGNATKVSQLLSLLKFPGFFNLCRISAGC